MNICSASVAQVVFSTEFRLVTSDAFRIVFVMVTNVVLTVTPFGFWFMHQPINDILAR